MARRLVGWAVDGLDRPVVCDPACGGGAFLLEAARHTDRLVAIDIDPLAVAVTEAALFLATGRRPITLVADALLAEWPEAPDAVVGNPPFLSQLRSATARDADRAAALGAPGYADEAALFLLASSRRARRVALLQPESVLGVAAVAPIRAELAPRLSRVWVPDRPVFAASVRVVGVVLDERGGMADSADWAPLLAEARGVPSVDLEGHGTLGEHVTVRAGFRDEYYGLAPFVREGEGAPLITSGLIDPNCCRWGEVPARYGKRRWDRPGVVGEQPVIPKVLVATQTRVLEAFADEAGTCVPCTPVISVVPDDLSLWQVLAVLLAPPVSAWALRQAAGTALSGDAIKLSATQVRAIPLPAGTDTWDRAAGLLRDGDLVGAGAAMGDAYGVDVLAWWQARLP